jgi:hypothetical protein
MQMGRFDAIDRVYAALLLLLMAATAALYLVVGAVSV